MKISVVIPLYNKQRSITATLDSVLAQTYTDYECIIVNDGSTDDSLQVTGNWIQDTGDYERFRLVNKENGGVSSARNAGINEARGEYIAFLDADDMWGPEYIDAMMRLINDYPEAGLYAMGFQKVYEGGRKEDYNTFENGYLNNPWTAPYPFSTASSVICRKSVLQELGGFDERIAMGEDLDMWWRILRKHKGAVCSKVLVSYNQDAENRAMHTRFPIEKHIVYFIEKYSEERGSNSEFRKYFDTQMVYRLYPYLFDKRYQKEAKRLAGLLDYSQLKWSMKFRMQWPWIYRMYEKLKGRNS